MIDYLHHGVGLKVFTQAGDINIEAARAEEIIIAPNLQQEIFSGKQPVAELVQHF